MSPSFSVCKSGENHQRPHVLTPEQTLPKSNEADTALFHPVSFSRSVFNVGRGGLAQPPSQRALERRAVMKEAIDFFVDFKEGKLFKFFFIFYPVSSLGLWAEARCWPDLWALGGIQKRWGGVGGEIRAEAESSRMRMVVLCV